MKKHMNGLIRVEVLPEWLLQLSNPELITRYAENCCIYRNNKKEWNTSNKQSRAFIANTEGFLMLIGIGFVVMFWRDTYWLWNETDEHIICQFHALISSRFPILGNPYEQIKKLYTFMKPDRSISPVWTRTASWDTAISWCFVWQLQQVRCLRTLPSKLEPHRLSNICESSTKDLRNIRSFFESIISTYISCVLSIPYLIPNVQKDIFRSTYVFLYFWPVFGYISFGHINVYVFLLKYLLQIRY